MVSDTGSVSGITGNVPGPPEVAPGVHRRGAMTPGGKLGQVGKETSP